MPKPNKQDSLIEEEIKRLHGDLQYHDTDSDEYKTILERTEQLYALKQAEKPAPREALSINTLLLVSANLVGILVVSFREETHVILPKAFSLLQKLRS